MALALRSGSGVDRFAVGAGLVTWVTQRSEEQPLCLLVDDAHLLDRPSQEALAFPPGGCSPTPVRCWPPRRTGAPAPWSRPTCRSWG